MTNPLSFADVRIAAGRLEGIAHRTPALTSRFLDAKAGASLVFKAENLQRAGAFKFRGGYNAIAALEPEVRARGVIAFSSGNHAQAIALAAQIFGIPAVILMPEDAPKAKIAATAGYGAKIVHFDRYSADRAALARQLSVERGLTLIPPFEHPDVIAGQGTAALELIEDAGPFDLLVVCLGGGGLIGGCALVAKALNPACKVIGVEPEAGNDAQQSFRKGEIVTIPQPRSIADGALTQALGIMNFAIIREKVDDIVTVPDGALVETMRLFAERMKLIVEPTGALAAAAVLSGAVPVAGKRVGIMISGGNVDLASFARLVA